MVVVKPEPQDEDRAKPPPRAPKMLSSFFGEFLLPPLPWLCWQEAGWSFSRESCKSIGLPELESLMDTSPGLLSVGEGCGMGAVRRRRTHNFLNSFPAPRKPAIKKEVKEEPGTPKKEASKG